MAIFSNTIKEIDVPVYEGYSFETCGHLDALMESLEDDLAITKAMHAFDMAEIEGMRRISALREAAEETGEDNDEAIENEEAELKTTLEEESKNIFAKIKEALKKLWGKITAFFGSIFQNLQVFFANGENFIKKNEKAILEAINAADFELKLTTYNYQFKSIIGTFENKKKSLNGSYNDINTAINKITKTDNKEEVEKAIEVLSKKVDGDDKEIEDMKKTTRGISASSEVVERTEIEITASFVKDAIDFIKKSKDSIKTLKEIKKMNDDLFKAAISRIETIEKFNDSESVAAYGANKIKSLCTSFSSKTTRMANAQLQIVKEATVSAVSICRKAMAAKGKKEEEK